MFGQLFWKFILGWAHFKTFLNHIFHLTIFNSKRIQQRKIFHANEAETNEKEMKWYTYQYQIAHFFVFKRVK